MFELIGMIVVGLIVWQILKGAMRGASRARSIEFGKEARRIATVELGVPKKFYSYSVTNNMNAIRQDAEDLGYGGGQHSNDSWSRRLAYAVYYSYKSEKDIHQSVNPLFHRDELK